jgi:uncharacterized protein with NRDE domain
MCTLTILREQDRVLVTMNRDDIAARPEAAPAIWSNTEPSFAAPQDLQAGGTWIGVNAHGVIACLLNRYDTAPAGRMSRGDIVLEAMKGLSVDDARNALAALDHSAYSPFTCIVAGHDGGARLDWTGAELTQSVLPASRDAIMLTSSSWRFDEVKAQREALFQKVWSNARDTADRVATFHARRESAHDAWAPMMQRPHSQTKSITQVELSPHGAEMRYWTRDAAIASGLGTPVSRVELPAAANISLEPA